ncbi:MAG: hypothetical protein K2O54_01530 [Prevotella sp.]|nr:hypothetical protein [Prevotella sp.]
MTDEEKKLQHKKDLERIKELRLIDDDFMTAVFRDNIRDAEMLLNTILGRCDLQVTKVTVQHVLKNLNGRSVRLDIHAVDAAGKHYDVEIQRSDKGAGVKRARHNSALLDASILRPGEDPEILPETYVIFIAENDIFMKGEPLYPIDRYVEINGAVEKVDDGSHILYVNGQYRGETPIGQLMHDFFCTKPDDMVNKNLSETVRFYKEDEKGVSVMCRAIEEMRNEVYEKACLETKEKDILALIESGEFSLEKIASLLKVSLDRVQELALSAKKA